MPGLKRIDRRNNEEALDFIDGLLSRIGFLKEGMTHCVGNLVKICTSDE
jgi:hypothetical protein